MHPISHFGSPSTSWRQKFSSPFPLQIIDTSTGYEQVEEKLETASLIRNSLLIHNPRREDFGVYNCSAENDFGTDHVMVSLAKQSQYLSSLVSLFIFAFSSRSLRLIIMEIMMTIIPSISHSLSIKYLQPDSVA